MADKELFQKVNEIDLEALIDNTQAKKETKNVYMSHDQWSWEIWHVYCVDTVKTKGNKNFQFVKYKVQSCFLKR